MYRLHIVTVWRGDADMSANEQESVENTSFQEQRTWLIVTYLLHIVGAILAIPSIVGLILNYVLREDTSAELRSHHDWQIRTFWWSLLWVVIGTILVWILVGYFILLATWLWWMYRHVRGLIRLADHRDMMV